MNIEHKERWGGAILLILLFLTGCVKNQELSSSRSNKANSSVPQAENQKSSINIINGDKDELTISTIADGRNLQLYDQGGVIDGYHWLSSIHSPAQKDHRKIENEIEKARDFIWEYWQNKKRGYIRVNQDTVDYGWTTHFFIEPGMDGTWEIARKFIGLPQTPRDSGIRDGEKVRQLDRLINSQGHTQLIFKDGSGIRIGEF